MNSNSRSLDLGRRGAVTAAADQEALTRIVSEDALYDEAENAIAEAREHGTLLSLLLLDLCGLQIVKGACGRRAGEQVVLEVARLLQHDVREHGFLGRIGGSEFLVVLKGRCRSDAASLGRRLQAKMGRFNFDVPPDQSRVSLAFGVAEHGVNGEELDDLLRVATMETHMTSTAPVGT